MIKLRKPSLFILLLFFSLACLPSFGLLSETTATPQTTETQAPSPTATPIINYTITRESPSHASQAEQLEVFNELWEIINQEYLYPDFNGLDWDAVLQEYEALIIAGLDQEAFYQAMREMVYSLGDDHSAFLSPQEAEEEDAQYIGNNDYVGIGIYVMSVLERDHATILGVFPGGPADLAGIQPHDNILFVEGAPVLDMDGNITPSLLGEEGSPVTITVQTPGQEPRDVAMIRARITGALPIPYQVLTSPDGSTIGYLAIPTFAEGQIAEEIGVTLEMLTTEYALDGLIIDDRVNNGGYNTELIETLSYFLDGNVGNFINRFQEVHLIIPNNQINDSSNLPLVILIGPDTVSFGEIFAGVMQDQDRAYLIGAATFGNVETLWGYAFSDGSRAWIAHDTFRPINHPDTNWEGSGVKPDLEVHTAWDLYTVESDPAVAAALNYFDEIND